MKASFWHACWERNSLGFHQTAVHPFLSSYLLPRLRASDSNVLVPLCGKSDDMVWLADHMQVVGAELSEIACRDFFLEKQLTITPVKKDNFQVYRHQNLALWQGDFFQLAATEFTEFDWLYDRAALIALPDEMQQAYVNKLGEFLGQHTRLFLISLEFPQHQMAGPPFALAEQKIRQLFAGFDVECLVRHELADKTFAQRTFNVSHLTETLYIIRRK